MQKTNNTSSLRSSINNFKASVKIASPFKMYTKDGFIAFIEQLTFYLNPKEVSELELDFDISNEIEEHVKAASESSTIVKKVVELPNIEEEDPGFSSESEKEELPMNLNTSVEIIGKDGGNFALRKINCIYSIKLLNTQITSLTSRKKIAFNIIYYLLQY